jgi:hypothetical protein
MPGAYVGGVSQMVVAHEDLARGDEIKVSSDRNFGFVFAGFFLLVAAFLAFRGNSWSLAWLAAAVTMLLLSLICPGVLRPAKLIWFRFGLLLHRVTSPVVLGFLFFGVITPIGLIMRLLGQRPCQLELKRTGQSYWMPRPKPEEGTGPTQFERQF